MDITQRIHTSIGDTTPVYGPRFNETEELRRKIDTIFKIYAISLGIIVGALLVTFTYPSAVVWISMPMIRGIEVLAAHPRVVWGAGQLLGCIAACRNNPAEGFSIASLKQWGWRNLSNITKKSIVLLAVATIP